MQWMLVNPDFSEMLLDCSVLIGGYVCKMASDAVK